MSKTETATLSDFVGQEPPQDRTQDRREQRREAILAEGGIYGRDADATASTSSPTQVCLTCGRSIPADVARVVGDNDGCVEACDHCRRTPNGERYSNVSRAVRSCRADNGQWAPEFRGDGQ